MAIYLLRLSQTSGDGIPSGEAWAVPWQPKEIRSLDVSLLFEQKPYCYFTEESLAHFKSHNWLASSSRDQNLEA